MIENERPEVPWAPKPVWHGIDTGPGWWPLIRELNEALLRIVPDYQVVQVKEKFGGLRFYTNIPYRLEDPVCGAATRVINFAEALSQHVCEWCGAPGETRGPGWLKTLCDSCQEKKQSGWRPWMSDEDYAEVLKDREPPAEAVGTVIQHDNIVRGYN